MHSSTLAMAALAAGLAAAVPIGLRSAAPLAPSNGGALGAYLDGEHAPDIYVELFDLNELELDLRASGLARLGARFLPLIEEQVDEDVVELVREQMGIDAGALVRGELSWEDALGQLLYVVAHEHLEVERGEALRAVAALGSRFSLAVDPRTERISASWSLRSGGFEALARSLDGRTGDLADGLLQLRSLEGTDGPGRLYRLDSEGLELDIEMDGLFLVLRKDLVALCTDEDWARRLTWAEAADQGGTAFTAANTGLSAWKG